MPSLLREDSGSSQAGPGTALRKLIINGSRLRSQEGPSPRGKALLLEKALSRRGDGRQRVPTCLEMEMCKGFFFYATLLLISLPEQAFCTSLYGQHVFGKVGVGGDRRLQRFGHADPWFNDLGHVVMRGPVAGSNGTLLYLGPPAPGISWAYALYQYFPWNGTAVEVFTSQLSHSSSLGTDLAAFDPSKDEFYYAVDGSAQTDYNNQMMRINVPGVLGRTGTLEGWSAGLGRLKNVGNAKVNPNDGHLYFAMWSNSYGSYPTGQGSSERGGIWRMNTAEASPTRELVVPNPTSLLDDTCTTNKDMVYGMDIDPTFGSHGRLFFSTGGLVWAVPVPPIGQNASAPTLVCDGSEVFSPTDSGAGFAPGQVYGIAANVAADEVYVVGATGDAVGNLLTCSISERKITRILTGWNLATDGDRFIVARGSSTGTLTAQLGVGTPCVPGQKTSSCGDKVVLPSGIGVSYPTDVAQVWANAVLAGTGALGRCYGAGYGAVRFIPNEVKRLPPLGFMGATFGPVRDETTGRIFALSPPGLYEIKPAARSIGLDFIRLLPGSAPPTTSLDQDLLVPGSSSDGNLYLYWLVGSDAGTDLVRYSVADGSVSGAGWSTKGPVCAGSAGAVACQAGQVCQNVGIDGSKVNSNCRYPVATFQQSAVFGKALYVARQVYSVGGGAPTDRGGVFRLILDGPGSPGRSALPQPASSRVEITETHLFIRNSYSGSQMSGLAVDEARSRLFFSAGTVVYMTNVTADPLAANYSGKSNDVKICDVAVYLYPLAGSMGGHIVGLAYNPTSEELYVHGVNTVKSRRLVTCSVTEARVTWYNKYEESSSAYGDLKYTMAVPGKAPNIGVSTAVSPPPAPSPSPSGRPPPPPPPDPAPGGGDESSTTCDINNGPQRGDCPVAQCIVSPAGCTLVREFAKTGARCCPKLCNFKDANGRSCSAGQVSAAPAAATPPPLALALVLVMGTIVQVQG